MKKLLLVLAIGTFAACNSGSQEAAAPADTAATQTVTTPDTTAAAVDTAVNEDLNKLLLAAKSHRAYVYRYHNGIPSANNVPFMFHTNTHEVIAPGTNRAIMMNQRIPTSVIWTMNQDFSKGKCVSLSRLDRDSGGTNRWHFDSRNAVAIVRCPFFTDKGDLIGFVGVDFTEDPKEGELARVAPLVQNAANSISHAFNARSVTK